MVEFCIAHWNANGLVNREPFLKKKMKELDVSFCGVAESHTYRNTHLNDENWRWEPGVEHQPSQTQKYPPGGIGVKSSRNISTSIVATGKYSVWSRIEFEDGIPLFQCECYFPHSAKTRQHREAWREIQARAREYGELGHIAVMGDFNAHIGVNGGGTDSAGRMMMNRADLLGLKILNGTDMCDGGHTRIQEEKNGSVVATTIDFVMVSNSLLPHVVGMTVVPDRMGSDHCMLVLRLVGLTPAPGAKVKLREIWRVNEMPHYKHPDHKVMVAVYQEAFRAWGRSVRAVIASMEQGGKDDAEDLEKSFQSHLDDVSLEQIGRKLVGPSSTPLMTPQVKNLNNERKEREKELRRTFSDPSCSHDERVEAVRSYRQAKAAALAAVQTRREEMELQVFEQIESTQSDSKLFYAHYKKISGGLLNTVTPPPMALNADGGVETDPIAVLKAWRQFSERIANPGPSEEGIYDEDHKQTVELKLDGLRANREHQPELDMPISAQEVWDALRRMKNGTAPGVDGVTTTILKMAAGAVGTSKLKADNPVVEALVLLFNFVFDNEVWPERWATGIIFPLYKQDSRLDPGNYRPITLLSVVGKLFGSIVEARLSSWSETNFALADEQGGFRRSRGTPDLIFLLREVIMTRRMRGQPTLATFIDARKAYDTVWREGNYVRLHDMGVRGKLWRQLQAMASDPQSKVRLPFGETEYFKVTRGVAQGAVESPFLYACFINGLAEELKAKGLGITIAGVHTPLLMYADDVVFLADNVAELREMMDVVTDYARRNRYRLNGDKSAVMAFNANDLLTAEVAAEPWRLSGEVVEVKKVYKYLGIDMLQNVGNWSKYMARAVAKATRVSMDLEWACRRAGGMRPRAAAALWKAIVRPVLEYAAEIWAGDISVSDATKAESVQTNFARSMLGLVGCQSISNDALRAEMGMEKLSSRWEKLRLGYWRRLNVASGERTLVAVASLRWKHLEWGYKGAPDGWMGTMRSLLVKRGMYAQWHNPHLCTSQTKEEWKDRVYEAVESAEDEAVRRRFNAMSGAAAARYVRIKNWGKVEPEAAVMVGEVALRGALAIEPYLDGRAEPIGTRLKLMCRLGCLPTMTRVAREEKLPRSSGQCRLCETDSVEDIPHLLLSCPAHDIHRAKMLGVAASAVASAGAAPLCGLPEQELADMLLGKSTGVAAADSRINAGVTRFLKKAWRVRKPLTVYLNEVLGRDDTTWALKAHGDGKCQGAFNWRS